MTWTIRDGSSFDGLPDRNFVYRTVRILLVTACHVSVLPDLTSGNLKEPKPFGGSILPYLAWRRPKPDATYQEIEIPIDDLDADILPWLPGYLDQIRPRNRDSYNKILKRLSEEVERRTGRKIKINPLRFRHTTAIAWDRLGLSPVEISVLLGCSPEVVVSNYLMVQQEEARARLVELRKGSRDR